MHDNRIVLRHNIKYFMRSLCNIRQHNHHLGKGCNTLLFCTISWLESNLNLKRFRLNYHTLLNLLSNNATPFLAADPSLLSAAPFCWAPAAATSENNPLSERLFPSLNTDVCFWLSDTNLNQNMKVTLWKIHFITAFTMIFPHLNYWWRTSQDMVSFSITSRYREIFSIMLVTNCIDT